MSATRFSAASVCRIFFQNNKFRFESRVEHTITHTQSICRAWVLLHSSKNVHQVMVTSFQFVWKARKSWSFSPLSVDSSWRVWRCCWTLFTVLVLEHPVRSCIRVLDRRSSHYDVSDTWWCRGVPQNRLLYEVTSSRSSSRSSISCPLEVHLQWSIIYSRRQRMEEFSDCLSHKFLARSHNKRTYDDNDEMKFLGCMFVIIDALIVLRSRSNLSQLDLRVFSQSFVEGVSYFNSLSDNGWSSNTRNR